ncbi:MAG: ferredoxin [Corynebacterium sp.]|nr:ferredoxin [Corynebacterium sp.]
MHRIAVVGAHPAGLQTAEHLVRAGKCVDLYTDVTAPFGLVNRLPSHRGGKLRLIGNVKVGTDITMTEIARFSAAEDPEVVFEVLRARGVAFTLWEGSCGDTPHDWNHINRSAQLVPVCF